MMDLPMQEVEFETVSVNDRGEITARQPGRAQQFVEPLPGGVSLEMVAIPGGIFQMGSPGHTGYEDERPQHPVSLSPFFMGKYAVTQAQWQAVTGASLAFRCVGPRLPADRVSWNTARQFCTRLAQLTGRPYRLPSEAEWEYACRAGTGTPFYFGPTISTQLVNYVGDHLFAQEPKGIYRHASTEGGSFPPNRFGLYDMHGNLWEWCADAWHDDYIGAPVDGSAWEERFARYRVLRGGSWHEPPAHCRSAVRLKFDAADGEDFVGFRIALRY
jgi:formylglycine-generating enzyme required for sulfatase activity